MHIKISHPNYPISLIEIKGLFGNRDVKIDLMDKCRILIGENGAGKTSILSIINYLLNADFSKLEEYIFDNISIQFQDSICEFSKDDISNYVQTVRYIIEDLDEDTYNKIENFVIKLKDIKKEEIADILNTSKDLENIRTQHLANIGNKFAAAFPYLNDFYRYKRKLYSLDLKIIYLPTYRRIEADYSKLFKSFKEIKPGFHGGQYLFYEELRKVESEHFSSENSLIKFGMKDINKRINDLLENIRRSYVKGYSEVTGKMISSLLDDRTLLNLESKFDINKIDLILQRLGKSMLDEDKQKILEFIKNGEIYSKPFLVELLNSLLDVYRGQEKNDSALKQFANACNTFIYDKEFYYDESHVELALFFKNDSSHLRRISLDKLSSGEKQLISIMAIAHLETSKNLIFLIDEPEISLSLYWQKKFLPILAEAKHCKQIIAVTHSPFIFSNEFESTARSSAEYLRYTN